MEQFAQTRAPDDLFDDDFTPVAEPVPEPEPAVPSGPRGRGAARPERGVRGRGRGRVRDQDVRKESAPAAQGDGEDEETKDEKPPSSLKESGKPEAVKGDRSGTGGVRKPKLSEDELSARLASIKVKNAAREAAHARAEADEASFYQREEQERAKRLEERQNRRQMDSERERNRQRKMKAAQGREWDAEKREEDLVSGRGRGSQFRRGAYGGVTGGNAYADKPQDNAAASLEDASMERGDYIPREPGGRGGRGGRGRGRGRGGDGYGNRSLPQRGSNNTTAPDTVAEAEFPALPAAKASAPDNSGPSSTPFGADGAADSIPAADKEYREPMMTRPEIPLMSPGAENSNWADQVEAGTPATPA